MGSRAVALSGTRPAVRSAPTPVSVLSSFGTFSVRTIKLISGSRTEALCSDPLSPDSDTAAPTRGFNKL